MPVYRTLDDRFEVPVHASLEDWQRRAAHLRERILATAGLLPMPERTPLDPVIFDEQRRDGYSVAKMYFESLPGFLVTGNLYKPLEGGSHPAILSPHGHWRYGRLEHTELASIPARAINLARQGFVVFAYDMIGYNDSRQLPHDFGGRREHLWGLSLAGLQLWNSIRSVDFLQSLPEVDPARIGCTGASGGGTQTFLLAAVDERIKVAAPVNMISLLMQGGCLCENQPGLRLDTDNVELSALIAPRPLLMVSATGDWTRETLEREYPAMRRFYALYGAEDRVHAVRMEADHNYNRESREAMYGWMARWLQDAPAGQTIAEQPARPEALPDALLFHGRALPPQAVTAGELTEAWIEAAEAQLRRDEAQPFRRALLHALGFAWDESGGTPPAPPAERGMPRVVLATTHMDLERALTSAGFEVHPVRFTPFDAAAAAAIRHFDTYNRTAAAQRVTDIVRTLRETGSSALVADGDAALAALLARAVVPVQTSILGVGDFDTGSDEAFLDRLYIPGIRRAGDLRTATAAASGHLVIHDAGARFELEGVRIERTRLAAHDVVDLLKRHGSGGTR
jgi:hypothetical protein